MSPLELTGITRTHILEAEDISSPLHLYVVEPFRNMRRAARDAGIELQPVSGYRDFERQLLIWNRKFRGERPLYDKTGAELNIADLAPEERVRAILVWSALPGASRHHWGTDLDLIDATVSSAGYQWTLTAKEYAADAPFGRLAGWMDRHAHFFGFFQPFRGIRSGVAAEPWHFSFAPVAHPAWQSLTVGALEDALRVAPLEGKAWILKHIDELHSRYVRAIDLP